ncbi:HNH endonuclease signature motif containing protein [Duganella sp.]|uniref:HNH endonuclease n=1 Tax=Duganella sp. TaxID=1904440 RepID=UPI0031DD151B
MATAKVPSWRSDRRKTAERGYGGRWQRERAAYLQHHPLCVLCQARGLAVEATVVDHKVAHQGNEDLMWNQENWQPLCKPCHDGEKQQLEKSGTVKGCTVDGLPLDANHHWSKPARVEKL